MCPSDVLDVLDILTDSVATTEGEYEGAPVRTISRDQIYALAARTDPCDVQSLRRLFVLVQAWGSGLTGRRTPRFTGVALSSGDRLIKCLSVTATQLRRAQSPAALVEPYRAWSVPGVGPAFFTKWFTFAGTANGRSWQPLILDSLVLLTINSRDGGLGLKLSEMTPSRGPSYRYQAYVEAVHEWARDLSVDAQHVEWVLFETGRQIRAARRHR